MKSDPTLRRWYLRFNRDFHNNELPMDTVLLWEPYGSSTGTTDKIRRDPTYRRLVHLDMIDGNRFLLRIDPCIRWDQCLWAMALHHEMVHIKLWPCKRDGEKMGTVRHGKKFHDEMLRLADVGAFRPWW